ncbi:MAG: threonylcarbamoyl-AMP synthase [Deltaproteobacteria bacterium]|nr:MAG: threonylcarbamoyl-AMP synthase [Deltaproteobacteria bacterium]
MSRIFKWRDEDAAFFWEKSRRLLAAGGVLALPTETFYALAVDPYQPGALKRLFALKGRAEDKPVLLLVAEAEMVRQVALETPEIAGRLMDRFWPGPLTLILPARQDLPVLVTGGTGTVGVRQPRQAVVCRLLAALGFPLTGTSANRAGREPLTLAEEVAREFGPEVDLILDAGPCPGGAPSTIVDVTVTPPRLVRAGAIGKEELAEIIPDLQNR